MSTLKQTIAKLKDIPVFLVDREPILNRDTTYVFKIRDSWISVWKIKPDTYDVNIRKSGGPGIEYASRGNPEFIDLVLSMVDEDIGFKGFDYLRDLK
jgi:hypothetical protein